MNYFLKLLKSLSIILIIWNGHANAAIFSTTSATLTLPTTIEIPANATVGTIIYTSDAVQTNMRDTTTSTSSFSSYYQTSPEISSYGNNVYQTGVAGLGFRLRGVYKTPSQENIQAYFDSDTGRYKWIGSSTYYPQAIYLELIVTGTVAPGSFNLSKYTARLRFNFTGTIPYDPNETFTINFSSADTVVSTSSCKTSIYDKSVELGMMYTQRLTSIGTTSKPVEFSIGIICSSMSLIPTITFRGKTASDFSTVFVNTESGRSAATGVGVQLLYNNTAIVPNSKIHLDATNSTSEKIYIFSARIYQLLNPVSPGNLTAPITFTLDYSTN
ncbi:fimbrial protein [Salmonella enterica]|nr:fimbrial protein [Salmonella enterica]